jgi:hypothetical protein
VGILDWLFGKKDKPRAAAKEERTSPVTAAENGNPPLPADVKGHPVAHSEAENLRRWRDSGQARAWVEAHQGYWNHDDWVALVEDLRQSPYWPMQPDAIGLVLEDEKRQWTQRN